MERIAVFGLGYVGCVSAVCLADAGHQVVGVELDQEKIRIINGGESPIVEPGLDEKVKEVVDSGRLRATDSCAEAVDNSDIAFVCVGTPGNEHGQLQLSTLRNVCEQIGRALKDSTRHYTVVVRSTVLPGTLESVVYPALIEGAGEERRNQISIASNPEFMREGTALADFANPPFTLVGCEDKVTARRLELVYTQVQANFVHSPVRTAETVKYICNAYHALKVCFANEVGDICAALGADAQEVMRVFRMDEKLNISGAYLRPGYAFGGSCLPKDVKALLYAAHHADVSVPLLDNILPSNEFQIQRAIEAVLATGKKKISLVGLSFKPDTDDLRESPMVRLVEALIGKGCQVRILDRNVAIAGLRGANRQYITEEIPHISMLMCDSVETLLDHGEVLVLGMDCADSRELIARTGEHHTVIDLTRSMVSAKASRRKAA